MSFQEQKRHSCNYTALRSSENFPNNRVHLGRNRALENFPSYTVELFQSQMFERSIDIVRVLHWV